VVDKRHEYAALESIYLPIAIGVFAAVTLLVGFAVVRALIRRRRGELLGSQTEENNPLEIGYAVVLALVIAFLVHETFGTESKTDAVAKTPGLEVKVSAGQWNWRFSYPAYGITTQSSEQDPALLVVPTGTTVHFTARSNDVIHAFYVPGQRFKRDLFPGKNSSFDVAWSEPGHFKGECAEFCGYLHAHMNFTVVAMPPRQFRAWAASHRGGGA
jgi:cytochrome c oxidase subunit II